jgi:phage shock protein C
METTVKRLTRSRRDRVFGGVCGGLGEYLAVDAVLARVGFVVLTLLSVGLAVPLYLLAWLIVPLAKDDGAAGTSAPSRSGSSSGTLLGVLLVVAGVLGLASSFLPWFWHVTGFRLLGPVVLIVLGIFVLTRKRQRPVPESASATGAAPGDSSGVAAGEAHVRRLVRIHKGRKIAGVCAGIGAYFDLDPTIVRLFWLVTLLIGGAGLLLYLILWVAMPLEEKPA